MVPNETLGVSSRNQLLGALSVHETVSNVSEKSKMGAEMQKSEVELAAGSSPGNNF